MRLPGLAIRRRAARSANGVDVRVGVETLDVRRGGGRPDTRPRRRGRGRRRVTYRHAIDGLVREPGAFAVGGGGGPQAPAPPDATGPATGGAGQTPRNSE